MSNCFFCNSTAKAFQDSQDINGVFVNCPTCGRYILENNILDDYPETNHLFAGYLFETNRDNRGNLVINRNSIINILNDVSIPKTTMQKLEKLLLSCYKNNEYIGQSFSIPKLLLDPHIAYAKNLDEMNGMIGAIDELDWINVNGKAFYLTTKGLTYAENLLTQNIDSTKVFVAMGFKDDLLDALNYAIKPACKDCSFNAFVVSEKEHNNGITDEIIVAIKNSKFVIVDFTYNNCGAYFEAGYAQGQNLEVIRCCKKGWFDELDDKGAIKNKLHFDVTHYNFILWENHEDLKKKLKARIRATIQGAKLNDFIE